MAPSLNKVDLKSLGTVQLMIGFVLFMFGFVTKVIVDLMSVQSGAMFWGSLCFLLSGSLSISTVDHNQPMLVKSSLAMNLMSTVAALGILIMFCVDLVRLHIPTQQCTDMTDPQCGIFAMLVFLIGTLRALLFLSIVEICMSIWTFVMIWKGEASGNSAA